MHKKILISLFAMTASIQSGAQILDPDNTRIQWSVSGGMNDYKEPSLMELKGYEVGLHSSVTSWVEIPQAHFEADFLLGRQKYNSVSSGSMTGVGNIETRWRALTPIHSDSPTYGGIYLGLALHTLWNDLRGTSTHNGITYAGYQRSALHLWLPVRWTIDDVWTLDAGLLIYGRHLSKLSDVNRNYNDVANTQRQGQYVQFSMNLAINNGDLLKPFVRYTHLADSDKVSMSGRYWVEPRSQRWQIGAVWEFANP